MSPIDICVKLGPVVGMFLLLSGMRAHDLTMKEAWNVMAT